MNAIFKKVLNFSCMFFVALGLSVGTYWVGYRLTHNPYDISQWSLEDIHEESAAFNNLSDENLKRSADFVRKHLKEMNQQNVNRIEHAYLQQRFIILLLSIAYLLLFLLIRRFINQVIVYNGMVYSVLYTLLGAIQYFVYPFFVSVWSSSFSNPLTIEGFLVIAISLLIFIIMGELIKKYFLKWHYIKKSLIRCYYGV